MDKDHLQILIKKYFDDTASPEEKAEVDLWYHNEAAKGAHWDEEKPGDAEKVRQKMLRNLKIHLKSSSDPRPSNLRPKLWRVVVTMFLFSVALIGYQLLIGRFAKDEARQTVVSRPKESKINRFLTLPDGTVVILRPGSLIKYSYTGNVRTVWLTGEAYFDVVHQSARPFVVYSSNTSTIVLGTAFNIRAFKGQPVTVTVVRGKVSVAVKENKAPAVLTPNQQIQVDDHPRALTTNSAEVADVMKWTKADMQFQNLPFKTIAERLSERYNVQIKFANPRLEKCLITGQFLGTESLERVLRILSETMGTGYEINGGGQVYLTGNACN